LLDASNCGKGKGDRLNLQPQKFLDKVSRYPRTQQHSQDDYIQEVLNPGHALGAIVKTRLDALVPLGANCLVNAQALVSLGSQFLNRFHVITPFGLLVLPVLWLPFG
jgi:hypothetical protein